MMKTEPVVIDNVVLCVRLKVGCDCSFLYWHQVVLPIYLTDMFETAMDVQKIHVSSGDDIR